VLILPDSQFRQFQAWIRSQSKGNPSTAFERSCRVSFAKSKEKDERWQSQEITRRNEGLAAQRRSRYAKPAEKSTYLLGYRKMQPFCLGTPNHLSRATN
jgi:hypothetical protein